MTIRWQWCGIDDLSARQLYKLLAARSAVFVIEQNCVYQDMDGLDLDAVHLIGWSGPEVACCLRLLAPGAKYPEASIGRVLTTALARGSGAGREMLSLAVNRLDQDYPAHATRIGAQAYLQKFYGDFGFRTVSDIYMEDGIPHVEMLRPASASSQACVD
jgi:ElaA protein